MTKQRGPEPLRACPKARYEDGLDMAKNIGVYQPNLPFLFFGQEKTVNLF